MAFPIWILALAGVGLIAAIAKSSSSPSPGKNEPAGGAPEGEKKAAPAGETKQLPALAVYQILTKDEKTALMKTLPTRFVSSDKTVGMEETLRLERQGSLGEASAMTVLTRANIVGQHAILVALDSASEGVSGPMTLLVPLEGGIWEKYATKGSRWTLFLAPGEAIAVGQDAGIDTSVLTKIAGVDPPPSPGPGKGATKALPMRSFATPSAPSAPSTPSPSNESALGDAMNAGSTPSAPSDGVFLFPTEGSGPEALPIHLLPDTERVERLLPSDVKSTPFHWSMRYAYNAVSTGKGNIYDKNRLKAGAPLLYEEGYHLAAEQALTAAAS